MSPEALSVVSALTFGVLGLVVGWVLRGIELTRRAPPPEPPALGPADVTPVPEPAPTKRSPPGLDFAGLGVRDRFEDPCRVLAREVALASAIDLGVTIEAAMRVASTGRPVTLGQQMALDLVQTAWVEGTHAMAEAVRIASPLPEAVTERLLAVAHRGAFQPATLAEAAEPADPTPAESETHHERDRDA